MINLGGVLHIQQRRIKQGINSRHFTFLHVQAEEANVDAVDLLEGVEGALPEGERLLHLSRVDEPAMNRVSVD